MTDRLAPPMTAREVMQRLRQEGWAERSGRGWQVVFTNPGHDMISMTGHRGDVRTGTLQSMARAAGWEWPVKK